jgi:hypothetical protein
MENKLEQLLKKLLELWRKPNWKEYNHVHAEANRIMSDFWTFYRFCNYLEDGSINICLNLKLREIVSINSGLWQFVCENRLQPTNKSGGWDYGDWFTWWTCMAYEYRLIESSLKYESELEQFLLDNIKIWE